MLFDRDRQHGSDAQRRRYAIFEIAYTIVDFTAALCFIVGSVLFFYDSLETAGTWLFLIGSIFFAAKPMLRLARELKLAGKGDTEDLAKRFEN